MTNVAVMNAILAMDAYNRGYSQGIILNSSASPGQHLGNYLIIQESDIADLSDGVNAGFYAIAYEYNSKQIISYRGTDDSLLDPYHGWPVGGGQPNVDQGEMAFEFYQSVMTNIYGTGLNYNDPSIDISLTGHSMGGGLAGLVAGVYNKNGLLFDNMAFEQAADRSYQLSTDPLVYSSDFKELVYGANPITPWNVTTFSDTNPSLTTISVEGEAVGFNRSLQDTHEDVLTFGTWDPTAELSGTQLHSIATLAIMLYAQKTLINVSWKDAAQYFWPIMYNDYLAENISGMSSIEGELVDDQKWSDIVRTAIAYSAIDQGTRVYGDTGIVALFNDANKLGEALNKTGVSENLEPFASDISASFVQYAGELAINKILQSNNVNAINGVLTLSEVTNNHTLTLNFDHDTWEDAGHIFASGANPDSLSPRDNIFEEIIYFNSLNYNHMRASMETLWNNDTSAAIQNIIFATQESSTTILPTVSSWDLTKGNIFIGGEGADNVTGSDANELLLGMSGTNTLNGGGGYDILIGGDYDDVLIGGAEADIAYGDFGEDTFIGHGVAGSLDGDYYDGGELTDTIDYSQVGFGVGINFRLATANAWDGTTTSGMTDKFSNIEKFIGTNNNDHLQGSALSFWGLTYNGGEGSDKYSFDLDLDTNSVKLDDTGITGIDTIEISADNISNYGVYVSSQGNLGFVSKEINSNTMSFETKFNLQDVDSTETISINGSSISTTDFKSWANSLGSSSYYRYFSAGELIDSAINLRESSGAITPSGFGANTDSSGNITSVYVDPALGGNWIDISRGQELMHPWVMTYFQTGGGYTQAQYESYASEITLSATAAVQDIHFNSTSYYTSSDLQVTVGSGAGSYSFIVPYFENGKTISGLGVVNSDYLGEVAHSSSSTITANGGGNYTADYTLDIGFISGYVTVTYFLDKINYGSGSIDMNAPLTFYGTSAAENLNGFDSRDDILLGLGGNDNLYGLGGNDTLNGGAGGDNLMGGAGDDTYIFNRDFHGSGGFDSIAETENEGYDTIIMSGFDRADVRFWIDLYGTTYINDKTNNDTIYYGSSSGSFEEIIFDDVTIDLTGGRYLEGTSGNDNGSYSSLYGTAYDDIIYGYDGHDALSGQDGDDILYGGDGNDTLYGGAGNDTLSGGNGNDYLAGGEGNDTYVFGSGFGFDSISENSGEGDDTIYMGGFDRGDIRIWIDNYNYLYIGDKSNSGNYIQLTSDYVEHVVFDDTSIGLAGGLLIEGTSGSENMWNIALYGTAYNDTIYGYGGNDTLSGKEGHDTLYGGDDSDTLQGGDGDDILYGEAGNDYLYGNEGADTFILDTSTLGSIDTIGDFNASEGDKIDISSLLFGYDPLTSLIDDFVTITTSWGSTSLTIDRDGTGSTYSAQQIAYISNGSGLDPDTLIANGNLIA